MRLQNAFTNHSFLMLQNWSRPKRYSDRNSTRVSHHLAFAQKKKVPFLTISFLFTVLGAKTGIKKTCAQRWYARKSGNSPAPLFPKHYYHRQDFKLREIVSEIRVCPVGAQISGKENKSTKINFLGPKTAQWGGGLPHEGVVAKTSVPSLESLPSLGFEERNLGCPGNFAGISWTSGHVQKVCARKVRAHFPKILDAPRPLWQKPCATRAHMLPIGPMAQACSPTEVRRGRTVPTKRLFKENVFLIKLVRISGFSSLFFQRSQCFSTLHAKCAENAAIARKREANPEILTNLRGGSRKMPLHFLHFNGFVCSSTLFSNTSALTSSLLLRANSTCRGS